MRKKIFGILVCLIALLWYNNASGSTTVFAATAEARFGSEYYTPVVEDEFNVGVYINSDENVGNYSVTLQYDSTVLEYVSGADREENGYLYLEGNKDTGTEVRRMILFRVLEKQNSKIAITGGKLQIDASGNGVDISSMQSVNILPTEAAQTLSMESVTLAPALIENFQPDVYVYSAQAESDVERVDITPVVNNGTRTEVSGAELSYGENIISVGLSNSDGEYGEYFFIINRKEPEEQKVVFQAEGKSWTLLDSESYAEENFAIKYGIADNYKFEGKNITLLCNADKSVLFAYAINEEGEVSLFAYNYITSKFYQCTYMETTDDIYYVIPVQAATDLPQNTSMEQLVALDVFYAVNSDGMTGFYYEKNGELYTYKTVTAESRESSNGFFTVQNIIRMAIFVLCVIVAVCIIILVRIREEEQRRKRVQAAKLAARLESEEKNRDWKNILKEETKAEELPEEKPVISVKDVTIEFKIAEESSSSLKEYVIRTIQGKNSYRKFQALKGISFDVYRGEVVGIIGTNGSGKSTILKIISGAIKPTAGSIIVDNSKVQLLTLGTGFDSELTAKENVYLNGAIIGYTKEYIDEKYDEIVKFAELEGFMDEKVKNFSSGMVSRLGFAIATMRDTPEILILDEVLSVGDMFFRKKSEQRIQEMIHGGSTVLIVSHSTSVITANCTKAVWIEKGELRMVGEPKEVCKAYENMNDSEAGRAALETKTETKAAAKA